MNDTPILAPAPVMFMQGQAVAFSRQVAAYFEREHFHLLRSISEIMKMEEIPAAAEFTECYYLDAKGERRPEYAMTQKGLRLLVMGMTGPKARVLQWQFIEAFEQMEALLAGRLPNAGRAQAHQPGRPLQADLPVIDQGGTAWPPTSPPNSISNSPSSTPS